MIVGGAFLRRLRKLPAVVFLLFGVAAWAQSPPERYAVMPENPRPGEHVSIGAGSGSGARAAVLVSEGRRLAKAAFFPVSAEGGKPGFLAAVLAIPSTAHTGQAMIVVEGVAGIIGEISLDIAGREFESEGIDLNPTLTGIRTDPSPQRTAESEQLWAILNRTGNEAHGFGRFSPPVQSTRRTSQFGSRRVYRYSNGGTDVSIHAGVDYGVPTGTAVSACGPGRVVLARNRIVTGNSVIIEHLPGVYSLYYHLNTIAVAEGALVAAGTLLGNSGATGLATGPHLHWEIRVFGENADPDAFIARPIIDKDAILSKIGQ
ncbi:MAG: M23 family metallopeptidase [Treponema sp.]|nr:M23 family metallopeptidase [Treponema sp.]